MATLYKPVLIESVEQAETLPTRTPVLMGPFVAHRPFADKGWVVTDAGGEYSSEELIAAHAHLNPTALVPIEAEEETREHPTRVEERPESAYLQPVQQVRYKTRWETA